MTRTSHLSVSRHPGSPLPLRLGSFLPLHLEPALRRLLMSTERHQNTQGLFVSKCRCLNSTPAAQKQNQWVWSLGTCIYQGPQQIPTHVNI